MITDPEEQEKLIYSCIIAALILLGVVLLGTWAELVQL